MANYCPKCGSYRSEVTFETCTCGQEICGECMVGEPLHMKHQRDAYRAALEEAIEFAQEGWSYADDYYKEKWEYEDQLAKLKEVLGKPGGLLVENGSNSSQKE